MAQEEWSIQQVARIAGTTSRTLRHYDHVGIVRPSRIGDNGYRYYDREALLRLQRVLLLRELGLGIPAIADAVRSDTDDVRALESHLAWLREEQARLARQARSVQETIRSRRGTPGRPGRREPAMTAEQMFDGFDHTAYRAEVETRWGPDSSRAGDAWRSEMSEDEKAHWTAGQSALQRAWAAEFERGGAPDGTEAQQLAARQRDWLAQVPGTPGFASGAPTRAYFEGLAEMYAADERFSAQYGGADTAAFVRDAMRLYAARELA
jgi:DNA-binding transcriptional MerR regulator